MTSREIAELTGKRHDSVKRTVESCVEKGVFDIPQIAGYLDSVGRSGQKEYHLDKRSSIIVVAQLCPEFTARIVDRWQELEAKQPAEALPVYANRSVNLLATQLTVANLFNIPEHLAQVEAVKEVRLTLGIDFSNMLRLAPAQQNISIEEESVEPTELGKLANVSAVIMNKRLETAGFQEKVGGVWKPTDRGEPYAIKHHWVVGNKSGYNLKWKKIVLELL